MLQTRVLTPPHLECPEEGEKEQGEEGSYWTGSAVSWKLHFLALTGVCLKVFPFMRVFIVSLGFTLAVTSTDF